MKTIISTFVLVLFIAGQTFSQSHETDSISKAEISKLNFLLGNWKGNGWMMGPDGKKSEFDQTENIQLKLDGTILMIEGEGTSNGKVIHNALAIISYDKENDDYSFQSYLQNGRKGKFKAEFKNDSLYWYPMEHMRYIITLNDQGQWYEIGEMERNSEWFRFFEMTLNRY